MDRLLRRLARTGTRRAMAGGHWTWLVLAASAFVMRRARRAGDPVALSMPLRTGDRVLVTLTEPGAAPGDG